MDHWGRKGRIGSTLVTTGQAPIKLHKQRKDGHIYVSNHCANLLKCYLQNIWHFLLIIRGEVFRCLSPSVRSSDKHAPGFLTGLVCLRRSPDHASTCWISQLHLRVAGALIEMVRGHRSEEESDDAEDGCVSSQQNLLELCAGVGVGVGVSTSMSESMGSFSQVYA